MAMGAPDEAAIRERGFGQRSPLRSSLKVFLLALVAVGGPPLVYFWRYRLIAPVYFFAGDTFYYLDVARHRVAGQGFSFDGQFATNGFHPLWEWLLVGLGRVGIVDYSRNAAPLSGVFLVDLLLLTVGAATFCAMATRYLRRPLLALLIVAPGLFWVLTAVLVPSWFATWSYVNGMESALALLCFSLAFYVWGEEGVWDRRRSAALSVFLGLGVLARLDDVFLTLPVLALALFRVPAERRRGQMVALSPMFWMIAAYVLYNRTTVGVYLPISGATKAGFAVFDNLKSTLKFFLPVVTGDPPSALVARMPEYFGFSELGGRIAQMVLPALLCGLELMHGLRARAGRLMLLHAVCMGVILKAGYNFLFVQSWNQGQWYYTVSIAVANLVLVIWVDRLLERMGLERWWSGARRWQVGVGYGLGVLLAFNIFISARNFYGPAVEVRMLRDNSAIRAKLKGLGADRIIEFDDGITSYAADVPALAAFGLALDPEATRASRRGGLLDLARSRGYRIAVAHGAYADQLDDAIGSPEPRAIVGLQGGEFRRNTFRPLGGDGSDDGLKYYELVPVGGSK
jgi:hypothetical protein